ncbi:MAG TPA: hypothetical protein VK957_01865, partial [Lunatimonas sp.]|nr:hypothetical protein [Lunatimonas sp.]
PLVKKQFRVAKGQPTVWMEEKSFVTNMVNRFILFWVPPHPGRLKDAIDKGGHLFLHKRFFRLFFLGYFLRWVTAAGIFVGIFKLWGGTNGR